MSVMQRSGTIVLVAAGVFAGTATVHAAGAPADPATNRTPDIVSAVSATPNRLYAATAAPRSASVSAAVVSTVGVAVPVAGHNGRASGAMAASVFMSPNL